MDDQETSRDPSLSADEGTDASPPRVVLEVPEDQLERAFAEGVAEGVSGAVAEGVPESRDRGGEDTEAGNGDAQENEEEDEEEEEEDDHFKTWMAIAIAIVTLVGAWMGSITAEVAGSAGWATSVGVDAAINAEMTLTLNSIGLYKHYRAYTDYTRYQTISELLSEQESGSEASGGTAGGTAGGAVVGRTEADDLAAVQLPFFLARYLTRDGGYHSSRELGEAWAEAEQKLDLYPEPSFEEADFYQLQTNQLTALFIVLAFSLLFYTIAESLHRGRAFWRWTMGFLGTASLVYCVWATLWIDLWMG